MINDVANGSPHSPTVKPGTVYSVRVTNFMTYRDCLFRPDPGFNVILGPNGSGKSTLVTALTVGLGGDLSTLRRQKRFSDLIKWDQEDTDCAEVIILLHNHNDGGHVKKTEILCTIYSDERCPAYAIDGKSVERKDVVKLSENLQIQTSNLCQFLPQDVVRQFPEMTPHNMFQSTLRAVGNVEMMALHDLLTSKREKCDELRGLLRQKKDTYKATLASYESKSELRKAEEERKTISRSIQTWEAQETFLLLKKREGQLNDVEEKMSVVKHQINEAMEKYESLKIIMDGLELEKKKLVDEISRCDDAIKVLSSANCVNDLIDDIHMLDGKLKQIERELKEDCRNREKTLQELAILETEQTQSDIDKYHKHLAEMTESVGECESFDFQLKKDREILTKNVNVTRAKVDYLEKMLNNIESEDHRKLQLLKKRNSDAYRGVLWLRENKQFFKGCVHEPIMMCLELLSPEYAVEIEDTINPSEMEAFICEDRDDTNLLMKKLREENNLHKINVVHVRSDQKKVHFERPKWLSTIGDVRPIFLDELFTCPPIIMQYLRLKCKLHSIPIFDKEVNFEDRKCYCPKYYANKKAFFMRSSIYSKDIFEEMKNISCQHPRYLIFSPDENDQAEVENIKTQIRINKESLTEYTHKDEEILRKLSDNSSKLSYYHNQRKEIEDILRECVRRQAEISLKQELLKQLSNSKCLEKERSECLQQRRLKVLKLSSATAKEAKKAKESVEIAIKKKHYQLLLKRQAYMCGKQEGKIEQNAALRETLTDQMCSLKTQQSSLRTEMQALLKKLPWYKSNSKGYNSPSEWVARIKKEKCAKELPAVVVKLLDLKKELAEMPVLSDRIISELEKTEKKKIDAEAELNIIERNLSECRQVVVESEQKLTIGIESLVNSINNRFSRLLKAMGFAGEVRMQKGENEVDLQNYGLQIFVKFRHNEELHPLSSQHQSGGEKAVSTALFIMALQEMTQVPFRCVDEINQGMDADNEKKVWELLLDAHSKRSSSQFFYLAQKFPEQIEFDENLTVHVCCNGKIGDKANQTKMDLTAILRRRNES